MKLKKKSFTWETNSKGFKVTVKVLDFITCFTVGLQRLKKESSTPSGADEEWCQRRNERCHCHCVNVSNTPWQRCRLKGLFWAAVISLPGWAQSPQCLAWKLPQLPPGRRARRISSLSPWWVLRGWAPRGPILRLSAHLAARRPLLLRSPG